MSRPPASVSRVWSQIDEDEVVALAQRLIRIPSVFRPGEPDANESAVAREVAAWLGAEGLSVAVQEVAPGRPNVVGWLDGDRPGSTLCLEGHTDVVTEGNPAEWRHGPWSGVVEAGRLHGRGAADMKGGLAAAMVTLAAFHRARLSFDGRLMLAALVDEEGAMSGARHFIRSELGRALTAAIICEPEENELCLEQKGVFWTRVIVRGRMAHGAMPYAGANPIAAVGAFLSGLPALARAVRLGVPRSRFLGLPHVTPTRVRAPVDHVAQNNVIPSSAECVLDVRLTPGLEPATVLSALEALARRTELLCPGTKIELAVLEPARPATRVERTEPIVRALEWGMRLASGRAPRFGGVPGSTDGTIFRSEGGIPIVTCGPGNRQVPHQVDEYVEVAALAEAARAYAAAAVRFLSGCSVPAAG